MKSVGHSGLVHVAGVVVLRLTLSNSLDEKIGSELEHGVDSVRRAERLAQAVRIQLVVVVHRGAPPVFVVPLQHQQHAHQHAVLVGDKPPQALETVDLLGVRHQVVVFVVQRVVVAPDIESHGGVELVVQAAAQSILHLRRVVQHRLPKLSRLAGAPHFVVRELVVAVEVVPSACFGEAGFVTQRVGAHGQCASRGAFAADAVATSRLRAPELSISIGRIAALDAIDAHSVPVLCLYQPAKLAQTAIGMNLAGSDVVIFAAFDVKQLVRCTELLNHVVARNVQDASVLCPNSFGNRAHNVLPHVHKVGFQLIESF
mmetsp:Transcript_46712/g.86974  ORF Transcript_46712/g.86974 Transcript_46712/m.86974 type:complete len:315 (-) Transcript_46712:2712-3656(-)